MKISEKLSDAAFGIGGESRGCRRFRPGCPRPEKINVKDVDVQPQWLCASETLREARIRSSTARRNSLDDGVDVVSEILTGSKLGPGGTVTPGALVNEVD